MDLACRHGTSEGIDTRCFWFLCLTRDVKLRTQDLGRPPEPRPEASDFVTSSPSSRVRSPRLAMAMGGSGSDLQYYDLLGVWVHTLDETREQGWRGRENSGAAVACAHLWGMAWGHHPRPGPHWPDTEGQSPACPGHLDGSNNSGILGVSLDDPLTALGSRLSAGLVTSAGGLCAGRVGGEPALSLHPHSLESACRLQAGPGRNITSQSVASERSVFAPVGRGSEFKS